MYHRMPPQRYIIRGCVCLCLLVVAFLGGCGGPGPVHAYTLARLHIPHLQWLQSLSRIPEANGTHGGVIYGLTAFQQPGSLIPQVIVNQDDILHLIGIDGSGHHQLNMGDYCLGPAIITPDGQWVGCVSSPDNDNGDDRLQVATLHTTGTSRIRQIQLSTAPFYENLTWSPDGRYLVVVLSGPDIDCSVAIYSSPSPHTSFTQMASFTPDLFNSYSDICIGRVFWSAGNQLLFVQQIGTTPFIARLAVVPLLQGSVNNTSTPYSVTPSVQFQPLPVGSEKVPLPPSAAGIPTINPQQDTLIFLSQSNPETLSSFNLRTGQLSTLFSLPTRYQIRAFAWMPDERRFLIAVGDEQCADCGYYAISDVYLYSPDISEARHP